MISPLEKKKYKAELLRVQAAKAEMEYIIAQRLDEVQRLEDNVKKQEEAEKLLQEKIGA
jgi:hypothetical protein